MDLILLINLSSFFPIFTLRIFPSSFIYLQKMCLKKISVKTFSHFNLFLSQLVSKSSKLQLPSQHIPLSQTATIQLEISLVVVVMLLRIVGDGSDDVAVGSDVAIVVVTIGV